MDRDPPRPHVQDVFTLLELPFGSIGPYRHVPKPAKGKKSKKVVSEVIASVDSIGLYGTGQVPYEEMIESCVAVSAFGLPPGLSYHSPARALAFPLAFFPYVAEWAQGKHEQFNSGINSSNAPFNFSQTDTVLGGVQLRYVSRSDQLFNPKGKAVTQLAVGKTFVINTDKLPLGLSSLFSTVPVRDIPVRLRLMAYDSRYSTWTYSLSTIIPFHVSWLNKEDYTLYGGVQSGVTHRSLDISRIDRGVQIKAPTDIWPQQPVTIQALFGVDMIPYNARVITTISSGLYQIHAIRHLCQNWLVGASWSAGSGAKGLQALRLGCQWQRNPEDNLNPDTSVFDRLAEDSAMTSFRASATSDRVIAVKAEFANIPKRWTSGHLRSVLGASYSAVRGFGFTVGVSWNPLAWPQ